jgi:hypothetical protein
MAKKNNKKLRHMRHVKLLEIEKKQDEERQAEREKREAVRYFSRIIATRMTCTRVIMSPGSNIPPAGTISRVPRRFFELIFLASYIIL